MSQFKMNTKGTQRSVGNLESLANQTRTIEQETRAVLLQLSQFDDIGRRIAASLQKEIANISDNRSRLHACASALRQAVSFYESTEMRLSGKAGSKIKSRLQELAARASEVIRKTTNILGMDKASAFSKDPVNLSNGNYVYEKTFLKYHAAIPLKIRIFYNIQEKERGVLGVGWRHNYELSLKISETDASVIWEDGSEKMSDGGNIFKNTASAAVQGGVTGFAFGKAGDHIKIPGINKGKGGYVSVWKQVMTKSQKGLIKNIAPKTMLKGLVAYGIVKPIDMIVDGVIEEAKDRSEKYITEKGREALKWLEETVKNIRNNKAAPGTALLCAMNGTGSATCAMVS